jgi:acetyltransferase
VISLRPLCAQDGAAFQQFVRGLSPESRLHRFFVPVRELAPGLLASLTQVDQSRHVAVAAVEGDRIIGEGRYVALGDSGRAEFAVAVADEWQRHGIGACWKAKCCARTAPCSGLRAAPASAGSPAPMRA